MARKRKHPRRGRKKKRLPTAEPAIQPMHWIMADPLPLAKPDRVKQAVTLRHLLTRANRHV